MTDRILSVGLTFDDVCLVPAYSAVLPSEVEVKSSFVRGIDLNIPLCSAAMDTVTESRLALAMAREGGIGVVHKNLPPQLQAQEVKAVKTAEWGMIVDPVTVQPSQPVAHARALLHSHGISGLPVVEGERLVGIITNRDLRFQQDEDRTIAEVMTKDPVIASEGVTAAQAKAILHEHRIEKLPVVSNGRLVGLITVKDLENSQRWPRAVKDELGRLLVAAAVGVSADREQRTQALLDAGVDVLVLDTAHGHSQRVLDAVADTRSNWPNAKVLAGNVATAEATEALIEAGVDGVKVGIGPGSICTTRIVAGIGVPQVSAILDCVRVAQERNIPIVADGGIKYSGDIVKALAAGANTVMVGSLFAGTDEAPGEKVLYQGRAYKVYRGMGSIGAMQAGSADRYAQEDAGPRKLVPEGIEGRVPYKGTVSESLYQLIGGLRSGMGYVGCQNIQQLRTRPRFIRMTSAGLRESHVHDVVVTKEAPNYQKD